MFELRCKDVGFNCAAVVRGTTKEEVLKQAAEHAATVHGTHVTRALAEKVSELIRQEGAECAAGSRKE